MGRTVFLLLQDRVVWEQRDYHQCLTPRCGQYGLDIVPLLPALVQGEVFDGSLKEEGQPAGLPFLFAGRCVPKVANVLKTGALQVVTGNVSEF